MWVGIYPRPFAGVGTRIWAGHEAPPFIHFMIVLNNLWGFLNRREGSHGKSVWGLFSGGARVGGMVLGFWRRDLWKEGELVSHGVRCLLDSLEVFFGAVGFRFVCFLRFHLLSPLPFSSMAIECCCTGYSERSVPGSAVWAIVVITALTHSAFRKWPRNRPIHTNGIDGDLFCNSCNLLQELTNRALAVVDFSILGH